LYSAFEVQLVSSSGVIVTKVGVCYKFA